MKAAPLLVAWHDNNSPIYSAHFEPGGKSRLATAGGDNHVRLWKVEQDGLERKVSYLSALTKHTQAVNVVRWCPRGELLASAGDDGNVLLWVPSENPSLQTSFGEDHEDDVETWRVKTMCRSPNGAEIYDLAWSPDGTFFITGSMDNVARIYNASNGQCVRQIAEHNHYVQGVAWDPLNEFVATQSSDRSVHIYTLKTKDGQFSLTQHNRIAKMDLSPRRRVSSNSPAPPDFGAHRAALLAEVTSNTAASPAPSAPGTPQSLAAPMNPPPTSHSRRSSFGSQMNASRRSVSPSPSMPLPAVMPSASPSMSGGLGPGLGLRNTNMYANETLTSFFRRLTFTPDGSLLFTPAGQYKSSHSSMGNSGKHVDDIINTVYIYTRAGLNKPPVAHLPGHKKPSVAVKCSPIYYNIRAANADTKEITIDTGAEDDIPALPEPVVPSKPPTSYATMEPPPTTGAPSPLPGFAVAASPRSQDLDTPSTPAPPPPGPPPAFGLPYRIIYAVATQDAVHVYDTQQTKPLCVVSNLHYATFTDLTWSGDGQTLLMTSSDGFCSALAFSPGELGTVYVPPPPSTKDTPTPAPISVGRANSAASTPQPTPTSAAPGPPPVPQMARQASQQNNGFSAAPSMNPAGSPFTASARPASPARSMSASSIASSFAMPPDQNAVPSMSGPTPTMSSVPSVAAAGSVAGGMPLFTPPQTPGQHMAALAGSGASSVTGSIAAGVKRDSDASAVSQSDDGREKRRRIAPTLVTGEGESGILAPPPPQGPTTEGP